MPWTEMSGLPWETIEAVAGGSQPHEGQLIYLCDWPGCTSVADRALGCVRELGACVALCAEHGSGGSGGSASQEAAKPGRRSRRPWRNFGTGA